ncbi:glycosyltransferase [Ovoidimarina sediminis]|uniref:glycosyltransferase n=1 Tax=Ovoidimarina sediminis TaxID=3079856 RepID=UPI00290A1766|nr:glycosyltransferase [Rhodophyticola sp. MJ-SS7]MDU8946147.1 glycosyltransferase [Rhodophyticola sp. MJ-SS7]
MILVISPEPWDGHFVSKHHYAIELAKRGHDVIFHGPPQAGPFRFEKVVQSDAQITVLHAPQVMPGLRFVPASVRRALEAHWLRRLELLSKKPVELVWLFENSRFFDMSFAGDRLKIYHQVDLNQNFHVEAAATTANHVFCTSKRIWERLREVRADAKIIHHGVRLDPFDPKTEASLFPDGRINCAYVGNLSMSYLDRDLLIRSIRALPHVLFHFFGGFRENDPFEGALGVHDNVRLHGKVVSSRVLPILANADVLLVAYQKAHFEDQSNPHKMMEYMMSGKVTVATYTSEYEQVSELLAMCPPDGDYTELLSQVIRDIDAWNAPDQMRRRQAFAADNTYPRQLERIAKALGPKGYLIA